MTVINTRKALLVIDGDRRFLIDKNLATKKTRKHPAGFFNGLPIMGFWKAVRIGLIEMDVKMVGWNWDYSEPRFRAKVII